VTTLHELTALFPAYIPPRPKRDYFGQYGRARGFHRDFDRGFAEPHAVVGAVVVGLDDVWRDAARESKLGRLSAPVVVRQVDAPGARGVRLDEAAFDDAREQRYVDVSAQTSTATFFPTKGSLRLTRAAMAAAPAPSARVFSRSSSSRWRWRFLLLRRLRYRPRISEPAAGCARQHGGRAMPSAMGGGGCECHGLAFGDRNFQSTADATAELRRLEFFDSNGPLIL